MADARNDTKGQNQSFKEREEHQLARRGTARPSSLAKAEDVRPTTWRDFERSMAQMENSMDRLIRDFWDSTPALQFPVLHGLALQPGVNGQLAYRPFGTLAETMDRFSEGWREPVLTWTVDEDKNEATFRCEVPGLPKKDLNVEVTPDRIKISGDSEDHKYKAECIPGFQLNPDKADATYEDGVLRLTVGLTEPATAKSRTVKIR
jgi:HSP20 family molecular chaperone IbpA